jgi:hypothetical protein
MKNLISLFILLSAGLALTAQQSAVISDESKVPPYILPDPLIFNDGSKVVLKTEWEKRRSEIFRLFEDEVYGISPNWNGELSATDLSVKKNALNNTAVRKEIKLTLKNGQKEFNMIILLYLPHSQKPVPVFLGCNFGGNHTVTDEPDIHITSSWIRNDEKAGITDHKATEAGRGRDASSWQVNEIISKGYGLATVFYGDIDPDFDDGFKNRVHSLYDQKPSPTSWGTVAAWAWGLSRVLDYLETNQDVDSKRVIVMGHSRLGKAALWAGASDRRFAMVISNNSGCGGAALSKRVYGETVGAINSMFPHWFCDNFNKYNDKEDLLPVDQHELIALIAPRPVYVASAEDDQWADPKGEFLSCLNANPVYKLLNNKGLPIDEMPKVNTPAMGLIGYHIRTGGHAVKLYDWQNYLTFADLHLKKK